MSPTKETLLAWQNRPQRVVSKFIKQTLSKDVSSPNRNGNIVLTPIKDRQFFPEQRTPSPSIGGHPRLSSRSTSESSLAEVESYEDETIASKKFTGRDDANRVRLESISQITGVRFDDPN